MVCEVWVIRYYRENLWTAIGGVDAKGRVPWSKLPAPELSREEMGRPPFLPGSLAFLFTIQIETVPIPGAFGGDDNHRVTRRKYPSQQ